MDVLDTNTLDQSFKSTPLFNLYNQSLKTITIEHKVDTALEIK